MRIPGSAIIMLMACSALAQARSTQREVTPETIANLGRPFELTGYGHNDSTYSFRLAIPLSHVSPERNCSLLISTAPLDLSMVSDSTFVDGKLHTVSVHSRMHPVLAKCDVRERVDADTLYYEVAVGSDVLSQAALVFIEWGRFAIDEYSFRLDKFDSPR